MSFSGKVIRWPHRFYQTGVFGRVYYRDVVFSSLYPEVLAMPGFLGLGLLGLGLLKKIYRTAKLFFLKPCPSHGIIHLMIVPVILPVMEI